MVLRHGVVGELGGGEDGPGRLSAGTDATLGGDAFWFGRLGAGFVMTGLSPGVARSVEPSGIVVLLPAVGPLVVGPTCGGPPVPAELPAVEELHALEFDVKPPPSKVKRGPASPVPEAVVPGHGDGLSPPGLSSVAPRGIPFGCVLKPELPIPSGDVAPIPGVGLTCANPTMEVASQMSAAVAGVLVSRRPTGLAVAVARSSARATVSVYIALFDMAYILPPLRWVVLDLAARPGNAKVSRGTAISTVGNCRSFVNDLKNAGQRRLPGVIQREASAPRCVLKVRNARIVVVPRSRRVRSIHGALIEPSRPIVSRSV
jgi:hypothetical protein